MEALFQYLASWHPLSTEDKTILEANCDIIFLAKGDYFLRAGARCHQVGFVVEGILRNYHYVDGKEVTKYFVTQNEFATNFKSYNEGSVSLTYLQAETDTRLIVISKQQAGRLSEKIPHWDQTVHQIIASRLLAKANQKTEMLNQEATSRYLDLVKHRPEIIQHVPLGHIASYLGITQFSLSRIRKKLFQDDFLPFGKN